MSKRELILAAIRSALTNTVGVGTRIYRSRVEPMARQESPAIVVEPLKDTCDQNTSLPTLDWSLLVRVAVVTRANVPDQAADPVIESLHSKLMADLTLGGLAIDIQPVQVEFQAVEAADGQALEPATRQAINNFVIGCKQDEIWSAIKASCRIYEFT